MKTPSNIEQALIIYVTGLVQGVGFRPFIYKLACRYALKGWVENRNDGVKIHAQGTQDKLDQFVISIKQEAPIASNIDSINVEQTELQNYQSFEIVKSKNTSDQITEISPDIFVCPECLEDMKHQKHRINYPFINCTNCGPRFSIIKDLPYDREQTTMKEFVMCSECEKEYKDVLDRRFHAQPVACTKCGPQYELIYEGKSIKNFDLLLERVCNLLHDGKILSIKGTGGFHLACDATNEDAVKRLRKLKVREGKPFAIMFSNIGTLKEYVEVDEVEEKTLASWQRPIVLLKNKKQLAKDICIGLNTTGVMLPYMPFHFLLFEKLKLPAIVLTSGNISDEPIVIDNEMAKKKLSKISDALLIYNRDIYNRTDDSVVIVANKKPRLIRRSRGYAPSPIRLNIDVEGIIATGAELTNCFCIGKDNQAILSQHIGDLKNAETLEFYTNTLEQFKKLFRLKPTLIVSDMHPDYLSTKYADSTVLKKIRVQHHHAHIASCMTEHKLDEKVIGVSFDGTGFGDDNNIWGGEFFVCDLNEYKRYTHFEYIPMPGGDKVTKEPWRMAVSYLYKIYGKDLLNLKLPFLKDINTENINLLLQAIDKNINTPLTSSAGRLFDAVSAMINLCPVSKFHAEAPMRLESVIDSNCNEHYDFSFDTTISFTNTIKGIIEDFKAGVSISVISSKFHNTIINIIFAIVSEMSKSTGINKIVLSGGTFQNKYILERTESVLTKQGYKVYAHNKVPSNDGGIALGQIAIAAKRRVLKCV